METADQKWCWRMWSHICQMDQLILLLWLQLIHQRSQACCSPWGHNELDTTDQLNCTELYLSAISSAEACGISCQTGPAPRHWVCNLHPYPECDFSAGHQSPRERSWRKPILLPNYHSRRAERSQELLGIFQSRCMGGWMRCFLVKVLFHFPEASPSTTHHCSFMEWSVSICGSADLVTRRFTMNLTSTWTKDQIVHSSKAENYSPFYFPFQKISSNTAHLKFWN